MLRFWKDNQSLRFLLMHRFAPLRQSDKATNYTARNLHKLSSCVVFADNFRKCATLNVVYKEIFKLHISIELRQEYF